MNSIEDRVREILVELKNSKGNYDGLSVDSALSAISKLFMTTEEVEKVILEWLMSVIEKHMESSNSLSHIEIARMTIPDLASQLCVGKE